MPALPNIPVDPIDTPSEIFDPTSTTQEYTILEDITVADSAGPEAANRQPKALDQRTETLRARLNLLIETLNDAENVLLSRDGATVSSVMLGNLSMTNPSTLVANRIINLADGIADSDGATKAQIDAVQTFLTGLSASLPDFVRRDGTLDMLSNLDLGNNQIINLADPVNAADGATKQYVDGFITTLQTDFVKRDGTLVMTGALNMNGNKVVNLDLATPTADGDGITKSYLDTVLAAIAETPPGTVAAYAGATTGGPPTGWLLCDGTSYTDVQQPTLHALIQAAGYPYGGSGANFNVPDMRGRTMMGLDNLGGSSANVVTDAAADTLGGTLGAEEVTLTVPQLPTHSHTHTDSFTDGATGGGLIGPSSVGANSVLNTISPDPTSGTTGSDAAHPNLQPSMAMAIIIKI